MTILNNRAEAQGLTVPVTTQFLAIAGYDQAGDGGDALYRRVGSAPLHSLWLQTANGIYFEVVRPAAGISIKAAGAKWNWNGTTGDDDAVAIQAAIDFGQGNVLLPPGRGRVGSNLKLRAGTYLRGNGKDATAIDFYGWYFAQTDIFPARTYDFQISGMSISRKGNYDGSCGINIANVSSSRFVDLTFNGFQRGVYIASQGAGSAVYNRFEDVNANGCGIGFYIDLLSSNAHVFHACRVNGHGKVDLMQAPVIGFLVKDSNGNQFESCHLDVGAIGFQLISSQNGLSDDNAIMSCRIEGYDQGVNVGANVRRAAIIAPAYSGNGSNLVDSGTDSIKVPAVQ